MIQLPLVAALATVLGATVAVGARDSRLVALGLVFAMVAAPLASSPEPAALAIAFRIVGALLAGYLLVASARAQPMSSEGPGIGGAAELAAAAAAFAVGWFVGPVKPLAGPLAAQAAGISLAALAAGPLIGRDVLRAGSGAAVLALGISLLLEAWVGPASPLQQIALTALLVGLVGATSLLVSPSQSPATRRRSAAGARGEADLAGAADEPADGGEAVEPRRGDVPAAPEAAPVPMPNGRVSISRSRRPSRQAAPAGPPDRAARADGEAPAQPEFPAAAAPASTRARRLHPREPRR